MAGTVTDVDSVVAASVAGIVHVQVRSMVSVTLFDWV